MTQLESDSKKSAPEGSEKPSLDATTTTSNNSSDSTTSSIADTPVFQTTLQQEQAAASAKFSEQMWGPTTKKEREDDFVPQIVAVAQAEVSRGEAKANSSEVAKPASLLRSATVNEEQIINKALSTIPGDKTPVEKINGLAQTGEAIKKAPTLTQVADSITSEAQKVKKGEAFNPNVIPEKIVPVEPKVATTLSGVENVIKPAKVATTGSGIEKPAVSEKIATISSGAERTVVTEKAANAASGIEKTVISDKSKPFIPAQSDDVKFKTQLAQSGDVTVTAPQKQIGPTPTSYDVPASVIRAEKVAHMQSVKQEVPPNIVANGTNFKVSDSKPPVNQINVQNAEMRAQPAVNSTKVYDGGRAAAQSSTDLNPKYVEPAFTKGRSINFENMSPSMNNVDKAIQLQQPPKYVDGKPGIVYPKPADLGTPAFKDPIAAKPEVTKPFTTPELGTIQKYGVESVGSKNNLISSDFKKADIVSTPHRVDGSMAQGIANDRLSPKIAGIESVGPIGDKISSGSFGQIGDKIGSNNIGQIGKPINQINQINQINKIDISQMKPLPGISNEPKLKPADINVQLKPQLPPDGGRPAFPGEGISKPGIPANVISKPADIVTPGDLGKPLELGPGIAAKPGPDTIQKAPGSGASIPADSLQKPPNAGSQPGDVVSRPGEISQKAGIASATPAEKQPGTVAATPGEKQPGTVASTPADKQPGTVSSVPSDRQPAAPNPSDRVSGSGTPSDRGSGTTSPSDKGPGTSVPSDKGPITNKPAEVRPEKPAAPGGGTTGDVNLKPAPADAKVVKPADAGTRAPGAVTGDNRVQTNPAEIKGPATLDSGNKQTVKPPVDLKAPATTGDASVKPAAPVRQGDNTTVTDSGNGRAPAKSVADAVTAFEQSTQRVRQLAEGRIEIGGKNGVETALTGKVAQIRDLGAETAGKTVDGPKTVRAELANDVRTDAGKTAGTNRGINAGNAMAEAAAGRRGIESVAGGREAQLTSFEQQGKNIKFDPTGKVVDPQARIDVANAGIGARIPLSGSVRVADFQPAASGMGNAQDGRIVGDVGRLPGMRGINQIGDGRAFATNAEIRAPRGETHRYITGLELALILSIAGIAKVRFDSRNASRLEGRTWSIGRQNGKPFIFVDGRQSPFAPQRAFGKGDAGSSFRIMIATSGDRAAKLSTRSMRTTDIAQTKTADATAKNGLNLGLLGRYHYLNYFGKNVAANNYYGQFRSTSYTGSMGLAFVMAASGMARGPMTAGMETQGIDKLNPMTMGPADRIRMQQNGLPAQIGRFNLDAALNASANGKDIGKESKDENKDSSLNALDDYESFLSRLDGFSKKKDETDENEPAIINGQLSFGVEDIYDEASEDEEKVETIEDDDTTNGSALSQVLRRPKWVIQPGETLDGLAERLFSNADLGWLIADLNRSLTRETYMDNKRIVELHSRLEIELPVWQDIQKFNQNRKKNQNAENLVTIVIERQVDREVVESVLAKVVGAEA